MDSRQPAQNPSQERIDNFLGRFKSKSVIHTGADKASENALDQYLLDRTAEELRAARASEDKLDREPG